MAGHLLRRERLSLVGRRRGGRECGWPGAESARWGAPEGISGVLGNEWKEFVDGGGRVGDDAGGGAAEGWADLLYESAGGVTDVIQVMLLVGNEPGRVLFFFNRARNWRVWREKPV